MVHLAGHPIIRPSRPRSSVDQSGCLLSNRSQVRILPGAQPDHRA